MRSINHQYLNTRKKREFSVRITFVAYYELHRQRTRYNDVAIFKRREQFQVLLSHLNPHSKVIFPESFFVFIFFIKPIHISDFQSALFHNFFENNVGISFERRQNEHERAIVSFNSFGFGLFFLVFLGFQMFYYVRDVGFPELKIVLLIWVYLDQIQIRFYDFSL